MFFFLCSFLPFTPSLNNLPHIATEKSLFFAKWGVQTPPPYLCPYFGSLSFFVHDCSVQHVFVLLDRIQLKYLANFSCGYF